MNEPNEPVVASDDKEFLTMREVAMKLRFSPETLRRYMRAGKLTEIEWVDFLKNGKLRATAESVDNFILGRRQATQKIYSQSPTKSRG